jgi:hypothetical protein
VVIISVVWRVIFEFMRGKYNSNSNDSLFSLEYKIPYEKSSIE